MAIASGGGIEALASLLGSEAAVEAAQTLANLAKDEQNAVALPPKKKVFFWGVQQDFLNNKSTNIFYFENWLNKKRETRPHFLFWDLFEANHFGPISWIDTRCQDGSWPWFWPHVSFVLFWSSGDDLSQSHSRATCHGPQQQYWQQGSCGQGNVQLVVACLRGSSYCSSRTRRWFCTAGELCFFATIW